MKSNAYKINPHFEVQEPKAADVFAHFTPETPEQRRAVIDETARKWRAEGIHQMRATLTGPEIEGDDSGYPAGLWLEGWKDPAARMLDFGASEYLGGPAFPGLTASGTSGSAQDAQRLDPKGAGPTAEGGDAQ
jgi:hypothetical protein